MTISSLKTEICFSQFCSLESERKGESACSDSGKGLLPGLKTAAFSLWPHIVETEWKSVSSSTSVQFSHSVVSNSLQHHGLKHARPLCPSPTPGVYPKSSPLSWWCHPTISSSAIPFSSHLQSFPPSGSFPMSQLFTSGGQSNWSFSFNISLSNENSGLISFRMDWISLESKGLSRVFSNTTVQKHQLFST